MDNQTLKGLYEKVYEKGAYQNFYTFLSTEEALDILSKDKWQGKKVLEIGCGEGDLASMLTFCGSAVLAIDYAQSAIDVAVSKYRVPNLEFRCCSYAELSVDKASQFDIVVMQGVLEHLDDPLEALKTISAKLLKRPGKIITSSPSFLNPRGYIWMTLALLFDVPMSLSDVHFLCPFNFKIFAQELGADLTFSSVDQDWGHGERLLVDFNKRLRNALRDAGLDTQNVDKFLNWLSKTIEYTSYTSFSGADIVYEFCFK